VGRWSEQEIGDMLRARRSAVLPHVGGTRPRNRWPELHRFLSGHDLKHAARALHEHDDRSLAELDMSLRELRAQGWDERVLARALEDLGMAYVPYADGRTCLEWVAWLHHEVVVARE
jgi:hypothetical protein